MINLSTEHQSVYLMITFQHQKPGPADAIARVHRLCGISLGLALNSCLCNPETRNTR
ncbi:hypothetical protein FIBSPDRAFT_878516 [Athelia psychrophila]|uniref:Uncharacterized protein n=1 Tax=Athelia psychrophila TaxID=1759441 RepID=A0A167UY79_9AGAM|nr:hypothetical protein FIBSPDRAFT_878503 [Fibularhizoctonia sp. CBS 109695]KZP04444.1 hypothetical protein FIBSPDRAFT_878516 [Fibularhizoctonia sp. CBS 109695]